ncbi:hypothetical protein WH47_06017, partial [Habropoda laboriosa]
YILYSPDIVPSDCHLFRALQYFSVCKKFDDIDTVRSKIEKYFNEKSKKFYSDEILI